MQLAITFCVVVTISGVVGLSVEQELKGKKNKNTIGSRKNLSLIKNRNCKEITQKKSLIYTIGRCKNL